MEDLKAMSANIMLTNPPAAIKTAYDAYLWLKEIYTKSIAYEYDHVHNVEEKIGFVIKSKKEISTAI